jgi:tetratricopeptide (TPR) repeat protein
MHLVRNLLNWESFVKKRLCVLLVCLSVAVFHLVPVAASTQPDLLAKGLEGMKAYAPEAAIAEFSRLIMLSPDDARAYMNRGEAYLKTRQYDLAIGDFESAKHLQPDFRGVSSNLGVAWHYKKNYEKAIEHYTMEIEQFPDNYIAFFNRGLSFLALDAYAPALDDMETTLSLKPDLYWAACYKGDIFVKMQNPDSAKSAYEAAVALAPENPYAKDRLAELAAVAPDISLPSENRYKIQTGAFLLKENALRQLQKLLDQDFEATVVPMEIEGKSFHVVLVGSFKTWSEARSTLEVLRETYGSAFIIKMSH